MADTPRDEREKIETADGLVGLAIRHKDNEDWIPVFVLDRALTALRAREALAVVAAFVVLGLGVQGCSRLLHNCEMVLTGGAEVSWRDVNGCDYQSFTENVGQPLEAWVNVQRSRP